MIEKQLQTSIGGSAATSICEEPVATSGSRVQGLSGFQGGGVPGGRQALAGAHDHDVRRVALRDEGGVPELAEIAAERGETHRGEQVPAWEMLGARDGG